ncbi:MAG: hypothetical protein JWR07_560 [Nevskia sp.]|nr:hypothetical protein [Nevskia sp.]
MNKEMKFKVGASLHPPTAAITRVEPKLLTDCSKCEGNVNVGLFFDGTKNNREADMPYLGHSNVARLFDAYLDKNGDGYYPAYVPGVGTPFPEVGENGESGLGGGFAIGCEQRVLFGLCWVLNALHRAAFNDQFFLSGAQVKALCRSQSVNSSIVLAEDYAELSQLGLRSGLRMPDFIGDGDRESILMGQAKLLTEKLVRGKPRIKECFIDVFGFSRGAAEARVFCNWLDRLLTGGTLAGVVIHIRFLGIMDTVASAGFWSSTVSGVTGLDGGHTGWADSAFLRIPASVQNCVHMVAMHELRKNFPLDTVTIDGVMPPHCQEYAYPGSHSDIGGGYRSGELGVSVGKTNIDGDALKLAQIPLNHMLACAIAAGAPMKRIRAGNTQRAYDPFAIDPRVHNAFSEFLNFSTIRPRPAHEWLQPYLNWRWEIRKRYLSQGHVRNASENDRELLIKFNNILVADAALLDRTANRSRLTLLLNRTAQLDSLATFAFDDEARAVLAIAQAAPPANEVLHAMFDGFVHDSLAGFDHAALEMTGYWRYRKGFLGSRKRLIASHDTDVEQTSTTA